MHLAAQYLRVVLLFFSYSDEVFLGSSLLFWLELSNFCCSNFSFFILPLCNVYHTEGSGSVSFLRSGQTFTFTALMGSAVSNHFFWWTSTWGGWLVQLRDGGWKNAPLLPGVHRNLDATEEGSECCSKNWPPTCSASDRARLERPLYYMRTA